MSEDNYAKKREHLNAFESQEIIVPVIEEHAVVEKTISETGIVRLKKHVRTDIHHITQNLASQKYDIDRVPVNHIFDLPQQPRREGDTMIYPIQEEVLVTEKKYRVIEEVRVKEVIEMQEAQIDVDLKKETIEIERLPSSDGHYAKEA